MTGLFIFGLLCLVVGINPKFWDLVGWPPRDNESGESIGGRRFIRLVMVLIGALLVSFNFPGLPENLAYPGWFFFGVVALYIGLSKRWTDVYPFSMEDFKDDDGTQEVIAWVRVIALVLGAFSVGVGMQTPDEPKAPVKPVAVEQPAPAPAAEPVSEDVIAPESSG